MSRSSLPPKPDLVAEHKRAHAREVRRDLIILAKHRLANAQELDLFSLGFCWAVPVLMFPAGPYRDWARFKRGPRKGEYMSGEYWLTWPEPNAEGFCADAREDLDDDARAEFNRGIAYAALLDGRRFLKPDTMARRLNVTVEEREGLAIWTLGAIDCDADGRKARRAERRRIQDREHKAEKRRAAGAKPRALSVEKLSPWAYLGISRAEFYRLSKEERDQWVKDILAQKTLGPETEKSDPYTRLMVADETVSTPKIVGDHPIPPEEHEGREPAPSADPPPIIPTHDEIEAPPLKRRGRLDVTLGEISTCR